MDGPVDLDIVDRLRNCPDPMLLEAAREIETLRMCLRAECAAKDHELCFDCLNEGI